MRTKSKTTTKKFDPYSILEDVKSSNVKKMGFHKDVMWILYSSDLLYYFENVTQELYGQVRKAISIGKALHATGLKGKRHTA